MRHIAPRCLGLTRQDFPESQKVGFAVVSFRVAASRTLYITQISRPLFGSEIAIPWAAASTLGTLGFRWFIPAEHFGIQFFLFGIRPFKFD